jgi:hypothetical protein
MFVFDKHLKTTALQNISDIADNQSVFMGIDHFHAGFTPAFQPYSLINCGPEATKNQETTPYFAVLVTEGMLCHERHQATVFTTKQWLDID